MWRLPTKLRCRCWQTDVGLAPPLPVSLSPQKTVGRGRYIFRLGSWPQRASKLTWSLSMNPSIVQSRWGESPREPRFHWMTNVGSRGLSPHLVWDVGAFHEPEAQITSSGDAD